MKITLSILISFLFLTGCTSPEPSLSTKKTAQGPSDYIEAIRQPLGDAGRGKAVFRFETFGNEGFWAKVMQLQQGMLDSKMTPKDMIVAGLQIDMESVAPDLQAKLAKEFKTDLSVMKAPLLNDPETTVALVNSNAIVGVVAKDSNHDKQIDIRKGDMVGISCALCHTVTDKSAFNMPGGGTAGKRIDGLAPLTLNMGKLLSVAKHSKAYYANLQLNITGKTTGRSVIGLTPASTEAEVDAYLQNPLNYPVGTFDESHDGIGNSVKNVPLFRQDLAAPFGSSGQNDLLENISNSSYTTNLDMTTLATPEGKQLLFLRAGAAGLEIHNNYKKILTELGVKEYPFVRASLTGKPGEQHNSVGRRVDDQKLRDMTAYLFSLQAPKGASVNRVSAANGRAFFAQNCTSCHNIDQSTPVSAKLFDVVSIWPGYIPQRAGERGDPNQSPVVNSPGTFDDKMVIIDASDHGGKRGVALPLLLDMDRTTLFLHDGSVKSLDDLLNPARGKLAPHPFYASEQYRHDVIEFLRGLEALPKSKTLAVNR